jgi:5-methylcytosine-specific restriction endonuclease McrA
MRIYSASVRAKHGAHPTTLLRRKFREDNGYWPNRRGSDWIADKTRMEIYERDGWTCHICSEPVDRDAHFNDNLAPSLDHLVPKSLGGSHEPENLKTSHRICNSLKGASYELV